MSAAAKPEWAASRRAGPIWLLLLALLGALAPWIAPRPPDLQEDVAGARYLPPLTRALALKTTESRTLIVTSLRRNAGGFAFVRGGMLGRLKADEVAGSPEARFYLLGTDSLG